MSNELFFVDDQPRLVFLSMRFARVRKNLQTHQVDGVEYYLGDAFSYNEAIEILKLRIKQISQHSFSAEQRKAIMAGLSRIICPERGIGFTLMVMDLKDWAEMLDSVVMPEEYKDDTKDQTSD